MYWLKNKYNKVFLYFIVSILLVFFIVRPLNSQWHKFIAGDGIGYYAYLPAKFIYNDKNFEFKWFNKAYNSNYIYTSFQNPEDNFLVNYKGTRINKYYPGLSFIFAPFFFTAHFIAITFNYPTDGFSQPYQLLIGFASLFYLFIGLFYLRKLLLKLYINEFTALIIPVAIFYGTPLYYYSINLNSQSHVYSFTFIILFLNFIFCFFNEEKNKLRNLLLIILFICITVYIRPLNVLILLIIPAFINNNFFKNKLQLKKPKLIDGIIILAIVTLTIYTFYINYIQSKSFLPYTYTGEKFYFKNSKFFDALYGYNIGMFVYIPITFLSLFGIPFLSKLKRIILTLFFVLIIFLYSSWWYWPIVTRGIIDFYAIIAIFLGALITRFYYNKVFKKGILIILGILMIYYLFKNMQMHNGILDETVTYKEVFWRNFFRLEKANMYLIPPKSIIKKTTQTLDFESNKNEYKTNLKQHQGNFSFVINSKNSFSKVLESKMPEFFKNKGCKKIRFSFWCFFEKGVNSTHVFIQFYDKNHNLLIETPFYLGKQDIFEDKWDYKEFGYEIFESEFLGKKPIDKIGFSIWNVEGKKNLYIDELKTEFILTDRSYDIIK